jgi:hypothetical protein
VKLLKCNELISLLKSHNDLGYWTTPHFCTNGLTFMSLWIFCKVHSIQMPQMHCKIINLKKTNYGLKFPTWIRILIEGWNSIIIHHSYSNGFKKGHMDYSVGFALTFKCIFYYDFISIFFIGTHGGKKIWIEKNYNKNFNQQITLWTFQWPNLDLTKSKVLILVIFCWIDIFFPLTFRHGQPFLWTLLVD